MAEASQSFDEADVARRASGLLQAFFTDHLNLRQTVLDAAFKGLRHDPRRLIETGGSAATFAWECVNKLLAYGCSDQGRHSLARLLEVIREDFLGSNPHPDYIDLPRLLNRFCALPSREDEHVYLDRLLADIQRKADLYAPLRGLARIVARANGGPLRGAWDDLAPLRHLRRAPATQQQAESRDFGDILTAFGQVKRAALLGRPGAGKTTTLYKLAADLAQGAKADAEAPLPLWVRLGDWTGEELLSAFLASHLPEIGWALNALSGAKRAVLLLDGLNEIPTQQRQAKAHQVRTLIDKLDEKTPVYVSCRADDYVGELDLGLDTLTLQPLSPPQVRTVLHHWFHLQFGDAGPVRAERLFWQLAGDPALAGVLATWLAAGGDEDLFWTAEEIRWGHSNVSGKITRHEDDLWRLHVRNPRSLIWLAANPFMLTMLFWVWLDRDETLPRNRGELFARFVDALLERENLATWDETTGCCRYALEGEKLLAGLADLAWSMQMRRLEESGTERTGDAGVLTMVSRQEAVGVLGNESLMKKAEDATVLEGQAEIRFRHQLLQEYFMALVLKRRFEQGSLSAARLWPADRWWARSGWEEAAVLLAGLFPEDCTPIIRWLTDAQPEVTVQCLLESGAEIADRNTLFAGLRTAWLPRLTDPECEPEPPARAAVGRALGRLNLDNRKGIGLDTRGVPDIDWIEVPAGDFVYQDGERRYLETFWIGRYPITHAQFDAFIQDRGYEDDRWWRGLGEHIRAPEAPGWTLANHPRETVSWYEAMAFCAWLSERLGYAVTLPTEVQWEKAARGTDGRTCPWGVWRASRANTHEADIDRTSAVGLFPHGRSPYGVMDMVGNVWEWCLSEYRHLERTQQEGDEPRVLRGGSWGLFPSALRADDRFYGRPDLRLDHYGFRVVCAAPILP